MAFEKFSLDDLVEEIQKTKCILKNCDKEIKMWREIHIQSKNYSFQESQYLRATPAGISDIYKWEEELRSYRITQEENR